MQVRLNCIRHKLGTNRGEFLWHTVDIRTRAERALVVSPHSRSGGNRAGAGLRRSKRQSHLYRSSVSGHPSDRLGDPNSSRRLLC